MNTRKKEELREQLQLMTNNIEVISMSENYLSSLKKSALKMEETIDCTIRTIEILKDGFIAINESMQEIIE